MAKPTKTFKDRLINTLYAPIEVVRTGLNYAADVTGIDILESTVERSIEQFYSPRARAKILANNRVGVKIKGLQAPLKEAIASLESNLASLKIEETGFAAHITELQKNTTSAGRLKVQKLTNLETTISRSLGASFDLNEVTKRFQELSGCIDNDSIHNPRVIIDYIETQYDLFKKQLEEDKTAALKAIKDNIDKEKNEANPCLTAATLDKIAKDLSDKVTKAYETTKENLETAYVKGKPAIKATKEKEKDTPATPGILAKLSNAAENAEAELLSMIVFSEHSSSKSVPNTSLTMGSTTPAPLSEDPIRYRNMSLEDYINHQPERSKSFLSAQAWWQYGKYLMNNKAELITPSGLRMKHNGSNSISITVPSRYALYHHASDKMLGADAMHMVNQIKAAGFPTIVFTVDCQDPIVRQKMMEEFYYAAKMGGYSDDHIKFNVPCLEDQQPSHSNSKLSITNEPASNILGRLGNAPNRALIAMSRWKEEEKILKNESSASLRAESIKLGEHIQTKLGSRNQLSANIQL